MKRFGKILGIAVLLTGMFSLKTNARSVSVDPIGTGNEKIENIGSGGNSFIILGKVDGLHIMRLRPCAVKPGSDFLAELASGNSNTADLEVTTREGAKVWATTLTLDEGYNAVKFKVQNLSSGLYFLHIKTGDGSATRTFIVK